MKHLKLFEAFNIGILPSSIKTIENEWGISIEDLEDILIDLSDLNRTKYCVIKTPTNDKLCRYVIGNQIKFKYIPELIVLSKINVNRSELDNILSTIKKRLDNLGISIIDDKTLTHELTDVSKDIYYVCLILMSKSDVELVNDKNNSIDWR